MVPARLAYLPPHSTTPLLIFPCPPPTTYLFPGLHALLYLNRNRISPSNHSLYQFCLYLAHFPSLHSPSFLPSLHVRTTWTIIVLMCRARDLTCLLSTAPLLSSPWAKSCPSCAAAARTARRTKCSKSPPSAAFLTTYAFYTLLHLAHISIFFKRMRYIDAPIQTSAHTHARIHTY
jgi:hypothetical protein